MTEQYTIGLDKLIPLTFGYSYKTFVNQRRVFVAKDKNKACDVGGIGNESRYISTPFKLTGYFTLNYEETRDDPNWAVIIMMVDGTASAIYKNFSKKPRQIAERVLVYAKIEYTPMPIFLDRFKSNARINNNGVFDGHFRISEMDEGGLAVRYFEGYSTIQKGWSVYDTYSDNESATAAFEVLNAGETEEQCVEYRRATLVIRAGERGTTLFITPVTESPDFLYYVPLILVRSKGMSTKTLNLLSQCRIVLIPSKKATGGYKFVKLLDYDADFDAFISENPEYVLAKIVTRTTRHALNVYILPDQTFRFGTHIHSSTEKAEGLASSKNESLTLNLEII